MKKPYDCNVKSGDKFIVSNNCAIDSGAIYSRFNEKLDEGGIRMGDILTLHRNDNTDCPEFIYPNGDRQYCNWGVLEPYGLSKQLTSTFSVGDKIQFVDDDGLLCKRNLREIHCNSKHKSGDPLYNYYNGNGSYEIPINEGVIVGIYGEYAMVTWRCDEKRTPCVRFNIKNLKLINNDVQTVTRTGSQECAGGESGISSSGVELAIESGYISYTEINCTIAATCETSQISRTISIL